MSLKVIGGVHGGRPLRSVRGLGTRPLLGQVKAAVFNIVADHVGDAMVWDLFAGSGATGIEALSRGARHVVFVEKHNKALEVLRENLRLLGEDVLARSTVLRGDAWEPPGEPGAAAPPNLVFLDPPYALVLEDPAKSVYRARRLLQLVAPGGCLMFHFEAGALDEDDFDADLTVDLREWGSSAFAFLWRAGEAPERVVRRRLRAASEE
jgi:16S rRNA (guanine966-N2)-methyltransferase